MTEDRIRHRQGPARVVGDVPYSDRNSTLSLLPGAAVGRWLASHAEDVTGTLLDLGAGNQPFRAWYEPKVKRVVAVDAAPAPGLDALSLAVPLPFRDDSFDSILCTSVLEHVDNFERAIAEIARVLRPGGRLIVTSPFLYPEHEAPYDFWRTTHRGLKSVLERHGLVVTDLAAQGGPFLMIAHFAILTVVQAIKRVAAKLGPFGRLLDNRVVDALIAAPQEMLRSRISYRLSKLAMVASLGYMAVARKPEPTGVGG
jgi:SAM-dependent methyltransferase